MRSARGLGAGVARRNCDKSGTNLIARTSCVAAAFIAPVSVASVCLRTLAVFWFSRSTRPIGPYAHWSSDAGNPRAGLLFQLLSTPPLRIAWGCALAGRKPRHSNLPRPSVGSPGSTPGARWGSRPVVTCAIRRWSA